MRIVVKLGGSLMDDSLPVIKALQARFGACDDKECISILVIPGGGIFADAVRSASEKYRISDDAAHWMAILAMEQYAYYIHDKTGIDITGSLDGIPYGVTMLLPYRILRDRDELPHSWDVTADTIAAWIARQFGAPLFVKVTDVDGIYAEDVVQQFLTAGEVMKMGATCVDRALPLFLKENNMDCLIVNGLHPERVIDAVLGKDVVGTYIKGNI
ncbi:MAG: 5-(aminomethyl)-3-furanmethanol phosphate kinase [Methanolobus sp.]|nr:5-(aminomethyl)-3-furanmethanol phosphate kinase [Methanolobus sp.]